MNKLFELYVCAYRSDTDIRAFVLVLLHKLAVRVPCLYFAQHLSRPVDIGPQQIFITMLQIMQTVFRA